MFVDLFLKWFIVYSAWRLGLYLSIRTVSSCKHK